MVHYKAKRINNFSSVPFIIIFIIFSFCLFFVGNLQAGDTDRLIQQLRSRNPAIRIEAAQKLGELKDPLAVNPLITTLKKDKDGHVRASAEDALVNIGAPAVEPLTVMLKDNAWRVRRRAVRTLGKIKDPRALEPLVAVMKMDKDCYVRKFAALAIGETNDPRGAEILISGLKNRNLEVVQGAYRFFIRMGEPGSEGILIEALNRVSWNRTMVMDFLSCGNSQLEKTASECAKQRGFPIVSTPDPMAPKWGQAM
jgi:hypothetical protein